jgi:hypothetical protein
LRPEKRTNKKREKLRGQAGMTRSSTTKPGASTCRQRTSPVFSMAPNARRGQRGR